MPLQVNSRFQPPGYALRFASQASLVPLPLDKARGLRVQSHLLGCIEILMNTTDFTLGQKQALMELLVLGMYADRDLLTARHARR